MIDWTVKKTVQAKLQVMVKRILQQGWLSTGQAREGHRDDHAASRGIVPGTRSKRIALFQVLKYMNERFA